MTRGRWLDRVPRPPHQAANSSAPAPTQPSDRENDDVPIVPFVPAICPFCGGDENKVTGTQPLKAGRTRYHLCSCGQRFKSREVRPA